MAAINKQQLQLLAKKIDQTLNDQITDQKQKIAFAMLVLSPDETGERKRHLLSNVRNNTGLIKALKETIRDLERKQQLNQAPRA